MVVHCVCVIALTVTISMLIWGINANESGPYKVVIRSIENCADDTGTGEISVTSTAGKDERGNDVVSGTLTLNNGIDDGMRATGIANIWIDEQWHPIGVFTRLQFAKACSSMRRMAPLWFDILKAAGVKDFKECPVPKGTYNYVNYHIPGDIAGQKTMKYKRHRVQVKYSRNGEEIGCMEYIADILPK